ncbi:MAG: hypothetical protein ACPG5B_05485 [Chitinophagales bacterium]
MHILKDRFLSEHIHLLVYGESLEQHIQKIIAEKTRRLEEETKRLEQINRKAIEVILTYTSLSVAQIASMIDISQETVLAIQKKMEE